MTHLPLTIETSRLILRRWRLPDDLDAFHAIYGDAEVMRWLHAEPRSLEEDREALKRFEASLDAATGLGMRCIEDRVTGGVVGNLVLLELQHSPGEIEVGYHLARAHWNRGYATEAARGGLAYAFGTLGLARIIGITLPEHERSQRVLLKAGLVAIGPWEYDGMTVTRFEIDRPGAVAAGLVDRP